ncbi:MAG: DeoR/GlpR transcriptional regulator [Chloroflexi bacterium]|nr:DeoR/GlpR transcriptional regulator [Chloroflexota bacterium]
MSPSFSSGRLRRDSISLVGALINCRMSTSISAFSGRGISAQTGITDSDPDEAAMKRAMIEHCVSVCVVAHHDKLEKVAPFAFARLERVRTIFTTRQANSDAVANYRAHGVELNWSELLAEDSVENSKGRHVLLQRESPAASRSACLLPALST